MSSEASAAIFDFAISFAGPDRPVAEQLAELLRRGGAVVFIDTFYRAELVGKRLDRAFPRVFGRGSRYVVPIVSQAYADRPWPQLEWAAVQREAAARSEEYVLPLRVDDSILFGLPSTVGYIDLRDMTLEAAADLLLQKAADLRLANATHWVATFGLSVDGLLAAGELPPSAPATYAQVCDWLSENLLEGLRATSIANVVLTEDSREGDALSVRVAFEWDPRAGALDFGPIDWWEPLELLPYDRVYSSEGE